MPQEVYFTYIRPIRVWLFITNEGKLLRLLLQGMRYLIWHSGPENLKKSRQINQNFFFREIAFLAVLNFFPVQNLIFGHFWNGQKWNLVKKFFSWNWIIWFHEFFWPGLFLIFWPTVWFMITLFYLPKKWILMMTIFD